MSAELNSKIGAESGSMDVDARGPEPMAGDESEVSVTQAQLVGVLGMGVPRLACLWPAACLKWGPSEAQLHQLKLKTLARGQALWGGL